MQTILRSSGLRNLFCLKRNFNLSFILFISFNAIGPPDIVSSSTHPRYVTSKCWFYVYVFKIFNIQLTNIICSPFSCKNNRFCLIFSKMNTQFVIKNQSQRFSKSSLTRFSICTTSLCWYRIHEPSAYKRRVDVTACGIWLT